MARRKAAPVSDVFAGLCKTIDDARGVNQPTGQTVFIGQQYLPILADWLEENHDPRGLGLRWLIQQDRVPRLSGRTLKYWHWTKRGNRRQPQKSDLPFAIGMPGRPSPGGRWSSGVRPWYKAHKTVSIAYLVAAEMKVSLRADILR